jgi:hypothetical protein
VLKAPAIRCFRVGNLVVVRRQGPHRALSAFRKRLMAGPLMIKVPSQDHADRQPVHVPDRHNSCWRSSAGGPPTRSPTMPKPGLFVGSHERRRDDRLRHESASELTLAGLPASMHRTQQEHCRPPWSRASDPSRFARSAISASATNYTPIAMPAVTAAGSTSQSCASGTAHSCRLSAGRVDYVARTAARGGFPLWGRRPAHHRQAAAWPPRAQNSRRKTEIILS